jgi:hypothetical protein
MAPSLISQDYRLVRRNELTQAYRKSSAETVKNSVVDVDAHIGSGAFAPAASGIRSDSLDDVLTHAIEPFCNEQFSYHAQQAAKIFQAEQRWLFSYTLRETFGAKSAIVTSRSVSLRAVLRFLRYTVRH